MKIHNRARGAISEINMIPMIDVMLVILIIFMIITPFFVQSHIKVNLPKTTSSPETISSNDSKIIKITLTKNGDIYVNSRKTKNLEKELSLNLSKSYEKTVLVEADKTIPVQEVITALDTAKKLGAGKVGISVITER
ncbi:MAG: biopolymer transporter ExbD [Elusimicrobiales bacterium]|jgi:biopolymer transport protein ExbD|nr:biopolymer transporter ExbD [Elusimicrobiales bacterium]